ncbi:thiopeptide-type bacteriocin biosynthesis protein [Aquimarina sp. 2201CG1-2-11]|uniref:thiopeptide-type bacteriocin biosynthesis protein n=1 Tax=Aquimarina discodermiae TaxID=3231043 RepID=UPI003461D1F0
MEQQQNNWVSSYIFLDTNLDTLLVELIDPMQKELTRKKWIISYFFIRYWEGGSHIRFRVKVSDSTPTKTIEQYIRKKTEAYFIAIQNSNYRLEFNQYFPETSRYGGVKTITLAEKHFKKSSDIVLSTLKQHQENWGYSTAMATAIQLHIIAIKELTHGNINETVAFFETVCNNWLSHSVKKINDAIDPKEVKKVLQFFNTSYQNQKDKIDSLCQVLWAENHEELVGWSNFSKHTAKGLIESYESEAIEIPLWMNFDNIQNISKKNKVLWNLYDSLIHMTNNRLGIYLRDESFIAFLIMKGLQAHSQNKIVI